MPGLLTEDDYRFGDADADITDWMRWHWGRAGEGWAWPHGNK